jgi:tRNA A-37 threonylcarbamoyl transferase component Bud32
MSKTKLLAQGSYGCVYYPGYSCAGKETTTQYVSKLSRDDKYSKVEYDMGQRIKKIPHYEKRFIVVEKKCKVKKPLLEQTTDCSITRTDRDEYVLMYSKYLNSIELSKVLSKQKLTYYKLLQITNSLVNRITEMGSVGIVHMDLHFGNILWSKKDNHLYVIDFGLAIDTTQFYKGKGKGKGKGTGTGKGKDSELNIRYLNECFMRFNPTWPSWTLEYHFLTLMIKENKELTSQNVLKTITTYYNNNEVIQKYIGKQFIQSAYEWFEPLTKTDDIRENIRFLLSFASTWDYYKIALHGLNYILAHSIPFTELKFLLLLMIHPNPTFRPTSEELSLILMQFLSDYDEYKNRKIGLLKDEVSTELELELTKSLKGFISDKRNAIKENPYISING